MTKKETIKFTDGGMQDFSKKDYQNNLYLSNNSPLARSYPSGW